MFQIRLPIHFSEEPSANHADMTIGVEITNLHATMLILIVVRVIVGFIGRDGRTRQVVADPAIGNHPIKCLDSISFKVRNTQYTY